MTTAELTIYSPFYCTRISTGHHVLPYIDSIAGTFSHSYHYYVLSYYLITRSHDGVAGRRGCLHKDLVWCCGDRVVAETIEK